MANGTGWDPSMGRLELPRERPTPDLRPALMAVAGALVALGAVVFAADLFDDGRVLSVLVVGVLVAIGYVVLGLAPMSVAPVGVILVAAGLGALPPFLLVDEDTTTFTGILALVTFLWAFAWFVPLTQGRPFLLGLALAGAWVLLLDLSDDQLSLDPGSALGSENFAFYLSLVVGIGLLVASWAIDNQRRPSLATPFVVVGDLAAVTGAFAVAGDLGDAGGSFLVIVTGLVLGVVGHAGQRRLTTWLGAALVGGGLIGFVTAIIGDDPSARTGAFAYVVAGVVLLGLVLVAEQQRTATPPPVSPMPAPVPVPAPVPEPVVDPSGWHPDPMGRYASRWWDGTRWTDQVVDSIGRQTTDPETPPNW